MNAFRNLSAKISATMMLLFLQVQLFAQDKGVDIDIDVNKKEDLWYKQPWVWVVGGAVFILLLVALLRSGRRRD